MSMILKNFHLFFLQVIKLQRFNLHAIFSFKRTLNIYPDLPSSYCPCLFQENKQYRKLITGFEVSYEPDTQKIHLSVQIAYSTYSLFDSILVLTLFEVNTLLKHFCIWLAYQSLVIFLRRSVFRLVTSKAFYWPLNIWVLCSEKFAGIKETLFHLSKKCLFYTW